MSFKEIVDRHLTDDRLPIITIPHLEPQAQVSLKGLQESSKIQGTEITMLKGLIRIPRNMMTRTGVEIFKERTKDLIVEAMEVILVTAVVVMVHVLAIMALDIIKGDRFQQVFGMLMEYLYILELLLTT